MCQTMVIRTHLKMRTRQARQMPVLGASEPGNKLVAIARCKDINKLIIANKDSQLT